MDRSVSASRFHLKIYSTLNFAVRRCTVLYCTVLYCTVRHLRVLQWYWWSGTGVLKGMDQVYSAVHQQGSLSQPANIVWVNKYKNIQTVHNVRISNISRIKVWE